MRIFNGKTNIVLISILATLVLTGCTNWKQKYSILNVEHQNLKGLYEREMVEKGQLEMQVTEGQQTIEQLQKQIGNRNQSAAEVTGFGEGYDVSLDSSAGTITVTLPNAILFSPGKAALKKAIITELDHIRSVLEDKYSNRRIDIVGHTDSDPIKKSKWKDNWELSTERALTVLRYMVVQGIPKDKIRAVGCGDAISVASNASPSGKARNRRVEIVVNMR